MLNRIVCLNDPVNLIDPDGKVVIVPAVYYGGLALSTLTGYLIGQYLNDIIDGTDDGSDWRDRVDFDNWDFAKEYWDPPPIDPKDERCKQVESECYKECGDSELDCPDSKFDQGTKFRNCIRVCLKKNNC